MFYLLATYMYSGGIEQIEVMSPAHICPHAHIIERKYIERGPFRKLNKHTNMPTHTQTHRHRNEWHQKSHTVYNYVIKFIEHTIVCADFHLHVSLSKKHIYWTLGAYEMLQMCLLLN